MRSPLQIKLLKALLVVGVVAGFGSEIARHRQHRHGYADALARVCVDAALGRESAVSEGWGHGGHEARWVAERCAAHARAGQAGAP